MIAKTTCTVPEEQSNRHNNACLAPAADVAAPAANINSTNNNRDGTFTALSGSPFSCTGACCCHWTQHACMVQCCTGSQSLMCYLGSHCWVKHLNWERLGELCSCCWADLVMQVCSSCAVVDACMHGVTWCVLLETVPQLWCDSMLGLLGQQMPSPVAGSNQHQGCFYIHFARQQSHACCYISQWPTATQLQQLYNSTAFCTAHKS